MSALPCLLMIAADASAGSTPNWFDLSDGLVWLSQSYGAPVAAMPTDSSLSAGLEAIRENRPRLQLVVMDSGEALTSDAVDASGARCGVLVTWGNDGWLLEGAGECLATYSRAHWDAPLRPLSEDEKHRVAFGALVGAVVAGIGTGVALAKVEESLDAAFGLAFFGGVGASVGGAVVGATIPFPSARKRRLHAHEVLR